MYTIRMQTEKNSVIIAIAFFSMVTGLIWTLSVKVYPLLAEGSGASKGEFYTLVGIIFLMVVVFIKMFKIETALKQKTDLLGNKISDLETKIITINDNIVKSAEESKKMNASTEKLLERIEKSNEKSNEKAEKMIAASNQRIDTLLSDLANK